MKLQGKEAVKWERDSKTGDYTATILGNEYRIEKGTDNWRLVYCNEHLVTSASTVRSAKWLAEQHAIRNEQPEVDRKTNAELARERAKEMGDAKARFEADSETPAEASIREARTQANITDAEATAAISEAVEQVEADNELAAYICAIDGCSNPRSIVDDNLNIFCPQHAQELWGKGTPDLPFDAEPDDEGEPTIDEYGIIMDAFHDAVVAGDYQAYRAMYDDALLAGDSALAELTAAGDTVLAQQVKIEALREELTETKVVLNYVELNEDHLGGRITRLEAERAKDEEAFIEHAEIIEQLRQRVAELETENRRMAMWLKSICQRTRQYENCADGAIDAERTLGTVYNRTARLLNNLEVKS